VERSGCERKASLVRIQISTPDGGNDTNKRIDYAQCIIGGKIMVSGWVFLPALVVDWSLLKEPLLLGGGKFEESRGYKIVNTMLIISDR